MLFAQVSRVTAGFYTGLERLREPWPEDRRKATSQKSILDSKSSLLYVVLINVLGEIGIMDFKCTRHI